MFFFLALQYIRHCYVYVDVEYCLSVEWPKVWYYFVMEQMNVAHVLNLFWTLTSAF